MPPATTTDGATATAAAEVRTPTSDFPTIEASSLPDAIDLDETEDERAVVEAKANDFAAVNDSELLPKEPSSEPAPKPAPETRGLETSEVEASGVGKKRALADETPQPSDSDLPDFRPRKRGRVVFTAIVASAAAIVVAGVAWSRFARHDEQPVARIPARAAERAPERTPAPPTPAPEPTPAAPAAAPSAPAAALEGAAAGSAEKSPAAITVTVKTVPEEAVIFRAGKRLGAGRVEVSVERNDKQRFTALHDGYLPSNFVVDGSRDSITIRLKRIPKPRPEQASEHPYGSAPSTDATAASAPTTPTPAATTAPPATAAPAATAAFPAGTAPPAPAPTVPSTESPAP